MLQNPAYLNMILNSPQIKPLLDSNPQMRQMFENPQMLQMLLNPQNLQNMMGGMSGLGGMGNTNPQPNNIPNQSFNNTSNNVDPKIAYKDQNEKLKDMGFTNEDLNFEVLKQTNGNVDVAVERLLNLLG
jgi:ubiquilin